MIIAAPRAFLLVALGAVPGAWLRWQCALLLGPRAGGQAVSDLLVNLLGSLLLGMLAGSAPRRSSLLLFAGIGFCGSLTTFSGWMLEVVQLLQEGGARGAIALLLASPVLGVLSAWLGLQLGARRRRCHPRGSFPRLRRPEPPRSHR